MVDVAPQLFAAKLSGIEALQEAVKGANLDVTQLDGRHLQGALLYADIEGANFSAGWFDSGVRARGVLSATDYSFGFLLHAPGNGKQWGYEVGTGDLGLFAPGEELEARYAAQTAYTVLALPYEALCGIAPPL